VAAPATTQLRQSLDAEISATSYEELAAEMDEEDLRQACAEAGLVVPLAGDAQASPVHARSRQRQQMQQMRQMLSQHYARRSQTPQRP
jgi:hypothetical protein